MNKALVGIVFLLMPSFSTSAWAEEFYIVRDLTTQKCNVVDKHPTTDVTTITLADDSIYKTRIEAETALKTIKVCVEK